MQFGLERERIGDIIVYEDEAYVIVLSENAQYIKDSLQTTKKFKKSKIEIIDIVEMKVKKPEFEEIKISVSSQRLDNFISEIGLPPSLVPGDTPSIEKNITGIVAQQQLRFRFQNCKPVSISVLQ